MTTPMEDLLTALAAAEDNIKEIPCFACHGESVRPLIVMTENINEGAPENGTRAIIVGVCEACWNEEYHHLIDLAKEHMAKSGLALPNQLFKADVKLQ